MPSHFDPPLGVFIDSFISFALAAVLAFLAAAAVVYMMAAP